MRVTLLAGILLCTTSAVAQTEEHDDAQPGKVSGYEIVWEKTIADVGSTTTVVARCTQGRQVLGGGFSLVTPLRGYYPIPEYGPSLVRPEYKILASGPALSEVLDASTTPSCRHYRGKGWQVKVHLVTYDPSPNHPEGPDIYVYAICANVEEAGSGAGYWSWDATGRIPCPGESSSHEVTGSRQKQPREIELKLPPVDFQPATPPTPAKKIRQ